METLIKILEEIDDTIDFRKEQALIDDHLLDSFGVIQLVSEIEDTYGVTIEAAEMIPENFNSAEAIWKISTCKWYKRRRVCDEKSKSRISKVPPPTHVVVIFFVLCADLRMDALVRKRPGFKQA